MEKIYTLLAAVNLMIAEEQKTAFEAAFKDSYTPKSDFDRLIAERDNYKTQLVTAQDALKKFDGVDVESLKGEIQKLTNDLQSKENEYQAKIADMEFNNSLNTAITASGAKNLKAVKALLDIDTLKDSKNRDEDIKSAIAAVKTDNDYMFKSDEPIHNPIVGAQANTSKGKKMTLEEAMKYANAHPDVDISTLV